MLLRRGSSVISAVARAEPSTRLAEGDPGRGREPTSSACARGHVSHVRPRSGPCFATGRSRDDERAELAVRSPGAGRTRSLRAGTPQAIRARHGASPLSAGRVLSPRGPPGRARRACPCSAMWMPRTVLGLRRARGCSRPPPGCRRRGLGDAPLGPSSRRDLLVLTIAVVVGGADLDLGSEPVRGGRADESVAPVPSPRSLSTDGLGAELRRHRGRGRARCPRERDRARRLSGRSCTRLSDLRLRGVVPVVGRPDVREVAQVAARHGGRGPAVADRRNRRVGGVGLVDERVGDARRSRAARSRRCRRTPGGRSGTRPRRRRASPRCSGSRSAADRRRSAGACRRTSGRCSSGSP